MNTLLLAVLLSMSPISELRGGIPVALASSTTLSSAIILSFICILANMFIILPLFLFLDFFHHRFMGVGLYRKIFNFFIRGIHLKSKKVQAEMDRYGYLALAIFVAVPLPVTGAWTGTIIAWLLELNRRKSIIAIAFGVLVAGIIVSAVTLASINAIKPFF